MKDLKAITVADHDFTDAKVGDNVYAANGTEGVIIDILPTDDYSILVEFNNEYTCVYTLQGKLYVDRGVELYNVPVITMVRSIKEVSFRKFLEDNNIDWSAFLMNCKIENQRWNININKYYSDISELQEQNPAEWLRKAFNFDYYNFINGHHLVKLSENWAALTKESNTKVVWE